MRRTLVSYAVLALIWSVQFNAQAATVVSVPRVVSIPRPVVVPRPAYVAPKPAAPHVTTPVAAPAPSHSWWLPMWLAAFVGASSSSDDRK
ncbi:hypothetical protein [Variovorax paradoxus]|uniref:hypothetical protein n=1 Tax=Variovorax paradoxus TaxID=34073 RepID=UPI00286714CA|nr:hypothetical protein [Variovorax paradoxus]MDR6455526.1 hypothetical protein [Variovorax paradoxus]